MVNYSMSNSDIVWKTSSVFMRTYMSRGLLGIYDRPDKWLIKTATTDTMKYLYILTRGDKFFSWRFFFPLFNQPSKNNLVVYSLKWLRLPLLGSCLLKSCKDKTILMPSSEETPKLIHVSTFVLLITLNLLLLEN